MKDNERGNIYRLLIFIVVTGFVGLYWADVAEYEYFINYYNIRIVENHNCKSRIQPCNLTLALELPTTNFTVLKELAKVKAEEETTYYDYGKFIFTVIFFCLVGVLLLYLTTIYINSFSKGDAINETT